MFNYCIYYKFTRYERGVGVFSFYKCTLIDIHVSYCDGILVEGWGLGEVIEKAKVLEI